MTTKHALKFNGAPYTAEGELVNEDSSITRGTGRAKCTCGALSPEVATGQARRAWFKEHKANPEPVVEAPVQDEIPLDPEPVEEPAAEEPVEEPAEELYPFSAVVPFTKDSPASFWRFLGRDAVRKLNAFGALGDKVEISTNASNSTLLISGASEDAVAAARQTIEDFWTEALETVKEWKKTDPEFLARPREGLAGRKASYFMTGQYYIDYVETFVQNHS